MSTPNEQIEQKQPGGRLAPVPGDGGAGRAEHGPRLPAQVAARSDRPSRRGCDELRCGCGSLLARIVSGEVELKCRRCKRTWRVPLDGA